MDSVTNNLGSINIKDKDNSFISENKLFFVDKHDMLCVIDVVKNLNKGLCENVISAVYVPVGRRINIFVVYEHMDRFRLKRLSYDLDEEKLVLSYHLWFLDDGATVGNKGKMTNIGFDKITDHERTLRRYLVEKLEKINHINIVNKESDSGVVAFNVEGIFPQDVAVYLNKYGICLRAGNHCAKILKNEIGVKNTLRASIYIYNTKEEIDKLVSLLQDKNKILNEML